MNGKLRRWLRPAAFIAGGAAAGLLYDQFFGCTTGCVITSSPLRTMLYAGVVGWLMSVVLDGKRGT
nr:hypothetical protein [uncultured Dysosmobacter sp.]